MRVTANFLFRALLSAAGKTLTVHAVARASARQAADSTAAPVLLTINCMTLQSPSHIFRRILDGLNAPQLTCLPADTFVCPGACHMVLQQLYTCPPPDDCRAICTQRASQWSARQWECSASGSTRKSP